MSKKIRKIVCIMCPRGCEITVITEGNKIVEVKGYACPLGRKYAEKEVINPERTLLTVVRCLGGDLPTVSVKTSKPIPLKMLRSASKALAYACVEAPANIGDIIVRNLLELGADVVVTRPCRKSDAKLISSGSQKTS